MLSSRREALLKGKKLKGIVNFKKQKQESVKGSKLFGKLKPIKQNAPTQPIEYKLSRCNVLGCGKVF